MTLVCLKHESNGAKGAELKEKYMKHLKMLGLLVMAAASLMAFASSASATVLTSPSGTEYTGEINSTATETLTLKASVFTATCTTSAVNGTVTTNTTEAIGPISTLSFSNCDSTVHVLANGSLTINSGGEVFARENEVTVEKIGITCIYGGGSGTKIGTLTPGTTATLAISASLPRQPGSSAFCALNGAWTGKYKVTTPDTLLLN